MLPASTQNSENDVGELPLDYLAGANVFTMDSADRNLRISENAVWSL